MAWEVFGGVGWQERGIGFEVVVGFEIKFANYVIRGLYRQLWSTSPQPVVDLTPTPLLSGLGGFWWGWVAGEGHWFRVNKTNQALPPSMK